MVLNLNRSYSKSGWSSLVGHTQSTWSGILNRSCDIASNTTERKYVEKVSRKQRNNKVNQGNPSKVHIKYNENRIYVLFNEGTTAVKNNKNKSTLLG